MASIEEVAKKIGDCVPAARHASEQSVRQGGRVIRAEMLATLGASTGGSFRLRGVGKAGARLGVQVRTVGSGSATTALVKATGPWQFLENDTKRHAVGTRVEARGEQPVMYTPWGYRTGPWIAGGSTGKHPWRAGKEASQPIVSRLYNENVGRAIRTAF